MGILGSFFFLYFTFGSNCLISLRFINLFSVKIHWEMGVVIWANLPVNFWSIYTSNPATESRFVATCNCNWNWNSCRDTKMNFTPVRKQTNKIGKLTKHKSENNWRIFLYDNLRFDSNFHSPVDFFFTSWSLTWKRNFFSLF